MRLSKNCWSKTVRALLPEYMSDDSAIGPSFPTTLTVGEGKLRGDQVRHVQDVFRLLRRAREYLIEADRQLRDDLSDTELTDQEAWYADMDATDEWTCLSAEGHADAVLDILFFFEEYAGILSPLNGKPFLVGLEWQHLNWLRDIEDIRREVIEIQSRIAALQRTS